MVAAQLPPPASRTGFFDALAAALVIGLVVAALVGFTSVSGPGFMTAGEAAVAGGVAIFVIAAVLFIHIATVRRTLEGVREMLADYHAQLEANASSTTRTEPSDGRRVTEAPLASTTATAAPAVVYEPMSAAEEKQHVITIEGIGETMASRLNRAGIITIPQLLRADPEQVAKKIDVMPLLVREWQWMGQLMGVKGVGPQTAELLVRCGIHSVADLATATPEDIVAEAQRLKDSRKVRITGTDVGVGGAKRWIEAAKAHGGASVTMKDNVANDAGDVRIRRPDV